MYIGQRKHSQGYTLIEMLVVVGIIALISAIAIPGLARLGAFSRDEFKRAVSQVDSLLRAAQIYATTYQVNTAVVYNLDNFAPAEVNGQPAIPVGTPVIDTLSGLPVRQIEAAALMYELPSGMGEFVKGRYVPVPGDLGEFQTLPPGMAILLQNPELESTLFPGQYEAFYAEFDASNYVTLADENRIGSLGMNSVEAVLGIPEGLTNAEYISFVANPTNFDIARFPVHLFRPAGRISVTSNADECGDCNRERFALYIAPSADRPLEERLVDPASNALADVNGQSNLRYRKIYLYKSTARTSVPDEF